MQDLNTNVLPDAKHLYEQKLLEEIAKEIVKANTAGRRHVGLYEGRCPESVQNALRDKGYKVELLPLEEALKLYAGISLWISW